ncbi:hypothetical protein AYI68_g4470 [Smittium mucronatum]|uniref:Uncharacterized protein n=1 Tax=Smittium mucronatum TaxID=133383 RepID=A0A1R0GX50_9FUNG|nr:hypothetical protein AYI68_g4470 [Smittium mucronatum]
MTMNLNYNHKSYGKNLRLGDDMGHELHPPLVLVHPRDHFILLSNISFDPVTAAHGLNDFRTDVSFKLYRSTIDHPSISFMEEWIKLEPPFEITDVDIFSVR